MSWHKPQRKHVVDHQIRVLRKLGLTVPQGLRDELNAIRRAENKKKSDEKELLKQEILKKKDDIKKHKADYQREYYNKNKIKKSAKKKESDRRYYENNREKLIKKAMDYKRRKREERNKGIIMTPQQANKLRQAFDVIKALLHDYDHPPVNPNEDPFAIPEPETNTKKDWTRPGLWPAVKQDPIYRSISVALGRAFRFEEDWLPWAGLLNEWGDKNLIGAINLIRNRQEQPWPNTVLIELQKARKLKQEQRSKEAAVRALDES